MNKLSLKQFFFEQIYPAQGDLKQGSIHSYSRKHVWLYILSQFPRIVIFAEGSRWTTLDTVWVCFSYRGWCPHLWLHSSTLPVPFHWTITVQPLLLFPCHNTNAPHIGKSPRKSQLSCLRKENPAPLVISKVPFTKQARLIPEPTTENAQHSISGLNLSVPLETDLGWLVRGWDIIYSWIGKKNKWIVGYFLCVWSFKSFFCWLLISAL